MSIATKLSQDKRIARRMFDNLLSIHRSDFKTVVGRVLTVVDAFTSDPVQRKAMKNIMEDVLYGYSHTGENTIRYYTEMLAEALKENCDWKSIEVPKGKGYNPLTD